MKTIRRLETASGRLIYELTESTADYGICYGVRVISTLFGEAETAEVTDFSAKFEDAERFFSIIADNAV